jgi:hypothetical protein
MGFNVQLNMVFDKIFSYDLHLKLENLVPFCFFPSGKKDKYFAL